MMYVKYICKKTYSHDDLIEVRYGDVVKITVEDKHPKIRTIYKDGREIEVSYKIPEEDLTNHFYLYDDIESLDAITVMWLYRFKFQDINPKDKCKELQLLKELRYYINAREKFLKSCTKEDTQQEQSTT